MRTAIVGAGRQGLRRAQAILENGDEITLVADLDDRAAAALAQRVGAARTTDWMEAADADVDAILICVPPHLHADVAIAALQRGRHVLCEKPLAMTAASARSMVTAAERAGRVLKCGFNYRYHPAIEQVRAWMADRRLGRLVGLCCFHGTGGRVHLEREWRTDRARSGGGILMDQGVHVLDLFRWLAGPFHQVVGCLSTTFWPIAPLEDNAFAILKRDGLLATMHVSWTQWANLFVLELTGTEGSAAVRGLGGSYGVEHAVLRPRGTAEEEVVEYRGPDGSWLAEWRDFTAAIAHGREPNGTGREGAEALILAEAIYASAARGQRIEIEAAVPAAAELR